MSEATETMMVRVPMTDLNQDRGKGRPPGESNV
jgi:hypothetical protein